jgi:hypothetical protein
MSKSRHTEAQTIAALKQADAPQIEYYKFRGILQYVLAPVSCKIADLAIA